MATRRKKKASSGSYHHGNLREAVLEAALELIAEKGPRGFTLREVARRAGVSHTAPYRHFTDKDALLAAIAEAGFRKLDAALRSAGSPDASPAEQFGASGVAYVMFAVSNPAHFRIMFGDSLDDTSGYPGLQAAGHAAFAALTEGIEACQQAGVVRSGDSLELAIVAWSTVHGLASLIIDGRMQEPLAAHSADDLASLVTRVLFEGLGS